MRVSRLTRALLPALAIIGLWAFPAPASDYALRWFYLATNFGDSAKTAEAVALVQEAAKAGLNGVIVADAKFGTLDLYQLDSASSPYSANMRRFLGACRSSNIEVIPSVGTVSRAEGILAHDVNLAAGYEVRDAVFEVSGGMAVLVPDPTANLLNAGFEDTVGDRFAGWALQDGPGLATVADSTLVRTGTRSVRLQPAQASASAGSCRLAQRLRVEPHRCYRVNVWARTHQLDPPGACNISVMDAGRRDARYLAYNSPDLKPTQKWTLVEAVFNSMNCREVMVYVGLFGARSGTTWIDDAEIREIGMVNLLRRPGCPLTVRGAEGKVTYQEGKDYDHVEDALLGRAKGWPGSYDRFHAPPSIRMRNGLPDGTRLRVGFYHPLLIGRHQVDCCMTEPKAEEVFEEIVLRLNRLLGEPRRWVLAYNELRTGGACAACKATGKTPGQILADNFQRYAKIVRRIRPGAELIVWNDMFDPFAHARDSYYLVDGTLVGSWEGLSKDVIVLTWGSDNREKSMQFFAKRRHRQIASVCFDKVPDSAGHLESWLQAMDATADVLGIVYTTWESRYTHLPVFGKSVGRHRRATRPRG